MNSLKGHLLIASPHLPDPNFFRTVVLMVQHTTEGAIGLVLNRPSRKSVAEIWKKIADQACRHDQAVYVGGPVAGQPMAIHTRQAVADVEVVSGIYFSTELEKLHHIVTAEEAEFRMFVGYAGWGEGQLEQELDTGSWLTMPATAEFVFQDAHSVWKTLTNHFGDTILFSHVRPRHIPEDPSVN